MDGDVPKSAVSPHRPVGIWIMTIVNLLTSGVAPLLGAYLYAFEQGSGLPMLPHALLVLFLAGFGVAITRATVRAWQGNELSRQRLLALLVVYHVLSVVIGAVMLLLRGALTESALRLGRWVLQAAFFIGINLWYYQRRQTREWYQAMEVFK